MLDCEGVTTPPIALCDIKKTIWPAKALALLHTEYVRCSRALLCLCLILSGFFLGSCEHYDDFDHGVMQAFFEESQGLKQVPLDSIRRFSAKVDEWVKMRPESKNDPIYPEIEENIHQAMVTFKLEVDDSWDEDIYMNFGFGNTDDTDLADENDNLNQ